MTMTSEGIGFWIRIALLFLIRSGRSAATLSVMVITAVSALIFLSALSVGVNDAMLRNTAGLFSGHITGYGMDASINKEDLMTKGVKGVLQRVYVPGVLSNGNSDKSQMLCGVDPDGETAVTELPKTISEGTYPKKGQPQMLISRTLADELRLRIGDSAVFRSESPDMRLSFTVSGIYRGRTEQPDQYIAFCPLDVIPLKNFSWTAAVFLHNDVMPQKIIDRYREKWPDKYSDRYRFESWETLMPDLQQLMELENISMSIVILLVFGVVAVGIACSFVIFIIRNMREYGIMKAMGVSTGEMSLLIVMKVAEMNAIACVLGLLIGSITVWAVAEYGGIDISAFTSHNQYFTVSGIIYPRLTAFSLLAPPVTAFVFSLIAAIWPAVLVARKKASDIIRMI